MLSRTIRDYMTASPVTIGSDQSLATAHKLMRARGIRHLPVLARGRLVGIVSQRDLSLVETFRDVDPNVVRVEEAMTRSPLTVGPGSRLDTVARKMATRRVGSVVIIDDGKVIGVFTAVDGLRALADLVVARPRAREHT